LPDICHTAWPITVLRDAFTDGFSVLIYCTSFP